jgi:uroporphyrinogen III methyltransferase/synthase
MTPTSQLNHADLVERQPLRGRTILITRAAHQAQDFISALESFGARVISCPVIEIVEPASYDALDEAIANLWGYDWIVFTSANGVERFARRLETLGRDIIELDDLRVCAIGEATADRLRDERIHVDVVPLENKAEGVFAALADYLGGKPALAGLSFLIPRAATAREYLPAALTAAGARVDAVAAYRTVRPANTERPLLEAKIIGGVIDCVAFTSASTVTNFAALFETTDLAPLFASVHVACIGDITTQTAVDYGLHVDIQPTEFTIPALAHSIALHFATLA